MMIELLGYRIWDENLPDEIYQFRVYNTLNTHSYQTAKKDEQFQKAILDSDVLLPDGIGIVWAARMILGKKIQKIAGSDLHIHILKILERTNGSCFYLGSGVETLSRIRTRLQSEYPNIKNAAFSPPFKSDFSLDDCRNMIDQVNRFKPDVLFVGMTAPKQEKWVAQNKDMLDCRIICSIGAVFDFYAGTAQRPSEFWIKAGLEFFPRFLHEPRRLWKRNLISAPSFLFEIIKQSHKHKLE